MTANDPGPSEVPARRPPTAAAPVVSARAQLECIAGPEKGQKFRIAPAATVIGRDPSCDVVLTETPISRQHARIERTGDGWTLRNLSANGTLLNKKSIDEAPLVDGDAIGLGAKTRLRFVVETVTISPTGRPQFRARVPGADDKDKEEALELEAEDQAQPSLFQRRKKLFIALGAYLFVLIIAGIVLSLNKGVIRTGSEAPPELALVDMVRPTPGANPLRIVNETPDGLHAEDDSGQTRFIPRADLQAQKAERIPGIRNALANSPFEAAPAVNRLAADQCIATAEELYTKREQDLGNLYRCVRQFQRALAYLRNVGYLPDPKEDRAYRDALEELVRTIDKRYHDALLEEYSQHDQNALAIYNELLNRIPDPDSAIYKNIVLRKGVMAKRNPKLR